MINLRGYIYKTWKTKKELLNKLSIKKIVSERELRRMFQRNNDNFAEGLTDMYVVHSNQDGYKLTNDKDEILASIGDNYSRAITQLKQYYKVKKRVSELNQLSLEDKDINVSELLEIMGTYE